MADEHRAQVINYLKATNTPLGILVNFGHYPKIEHERFVNQAERAEHHVFSVRAAGVEPGHAGITIGTLIRRRFVTIPIGSAHEA